jgi:DNA polymerase V
VEEALDLNDLIVRNPPATFMMRVAGQSMEQAGILDGDLLVVDRSLEPRPGDVVIAYLNGELTVKHIERRGRRLTLVAANQAFPSIEITEAMDFEIWGVVTHVIRSVR